MGKVALEKHRVGVVRAVGAGGVTEESAFARCPHRQESVSLAECRVCVDCVEVRNDVRGRPAAVICRVPTPPAENQRHHSMLPVPRLSVGDVMTRNVLCVRPDLSLDAVTELFVETGLKAVPVVDEHGVLLGTVSESDVLIDVQARCRVADPLSFDELSLEGERLRESPPVRTVAEVMMPVVLTLSEAAPMTQAAALMAFEGVFHVVVLCADGRVVGILSASDVLYRLARADGYVLPAPQRFGS